MRKALFHFSVQHSLPFCMFRVWFWVPVVVVLIPSTVLHVKILVTIRRRQQKGLCKSLFYRLFFIQCLEATPNFAWCIINTTVPFVVLFRLILEDPTYFVIDEKREVSVYSPSHVIQSNATQSSVVAVLGTTFSAGCHACILSKLTVSKKHLNIRESRKEKMLPLVGFSLFLSLCMMTAYFLTVTFAAITNIHLVFILRHIYILPTMVLTFVNPWMLMITEKVVLFLLLPVLYLNLFALLLHMTFEKILFL
ncbi:hypothetical protein PRIPAC_80306 [Pristionchus pacificus]|uniref:G protein-coupled receptor n=1 Tax=Pristionchus pacificus TaxID=54126 RepID=A0A2A6C3L4_PRIPA|nr:hypothetical protein PRIPAC_80306 [Pristionchus pacificus]|eukprot:PDM72611.1 G protein-coupled receptor [Pristionchus pacificus]